jgi:hypothetical protein
MTPVRAFLRPIRKSYSKNFSRSANRLRKLRGEPAWGSQSQNALSRCTGEKFGSRPSWARDRHFPSRFRSWYWNKRVTHDQAHPCCRGSIGQSRSEALPDCPDHRRVCPGLRSKCLEWCVGVPRNPHADFARLIAEEIEKWRNDQVCRHQAE